MTVRSANDLKPLIRIWRKRTSYFSYLKKDFDFKNKKSVLSRRTEGRLFAASKKQPESTVDGGRGQSQETGPHG